MTDTRFTPSSKRNPCPVCDRIKDGDCRTTEAENLVLCHTYTQDAPEGQARNYKFLHVSKDGLWGTWVYAETKPNGKISGRKPTRTGAKRQPFDYHDRTGHKLIRVVRQPKTEGNSKTFAQYSWDGVEYKKGLTEFAKRNVPIYRYAEVREAIAQSKSIFLVEGEGKADQLWELGIPATTTIGGSKGYRSYGNYFDDLKDANLIICPDRDKVGIAYAEAIAKDFPEAKWCYIMPESTLWQHMPDDGGLDIADWIAEGATAEAIFNAIGEKRQAKSNAKEKASISKPDLITRITRLEEIESPVDRVFEEWELTRLSGRAKRELLELAIAIKSDVTLSDDEWAPTAKMFAAKQLLTDEWLLRGFLKAGRVAIVAAESKMGKSLLHYDWAYAIATGDTWGEFPTPGIRPVIIVQTDEPETDCQERIKARGLDELDNCRIVTRFMPQHLPRLKRLMESMGKGGLLILDSLTSINRFCGHSPKDPEYSYFVYELKDLASELGWGVVLITHTNKSPIEMGLEKIAGSYGIAAAASDILMMYRPDNAPEGDTVRLLRRLGGRSGAPKTWKLELNLEDYSFHYHGECSIKGEEPENAEPQQFKTAGKHRILEFLGKSPGIRFESQEIAAAIGMPWERCRLLCGEIFRDQLILRDPSKRDARAKVYYLPNPNLEIAHPAPIAPNCHTKLTHCEEARAEVEIVSTQSSDRLEGAISKRSQLVDSVASSSQEFEIADLKKVSNFSEHDLCSTGETVSLSSNELLRERSKNAEKNGENLRSAISNSQSLEQESHTSSDRFEIAPRNDLKNHPLRSQKSESISTEDAPIEVGDQVHYIGKKSSLGNLCGQRHLSIDRIEGAMAVCSYSTWVVTQTIPLTDLKRTPSKAGSVEATDSQIRTLRDD